VVIPEVMETKEKNEELKFIISRFDHYYESVNNKGNVYLTLNTFALAGIIAGYVYLKSIDGNEYGPWTNFVFGVIVSLGILSIASILLALKPYLISKKFGKTRSVIFFGDVSKFEEHGLVSTWSKTNEQSFHEDLLRQTHTLACGLREKYNAISWATILMLMELAFTILFGTMLIYNK
jgi:hypothetical protein